MTDDPRDRRARRRERREAARRDSARASGPPSPMRWLIPGLIVAVVAIAAVLAFVLPGTTPSGGSSSVPPATAGSSSASGAGSSADPVITGSQLPEFQNPNGDPAVGLPAPEVMGRDFAGQPVRIAHDGRPKAIVFLAHWCPHCQDEVPLIEAWVKAGGLPSGVDLISVATSIDASRPNYPPDAWFQREGWTVPLIVDPTNSVAGAYGLPAFPYWVFVGADGNVRARTVGEMPIANLEAAIRGLLGS
jgi:cytochrome c biogenesis protein CcmG, thiol:disulfide interchange protein DsbE